MKSVHILSVRRMIVSAASGKWHPSTGFNIYHEGTEKQSVISHRDRRCTLLRYNGLSSWLVTTAFILHDAHFCETVA